MQLLTVPPSAVRNSIAESSAAAVLAAVLYDIVEDRDVVGVGGRAAGTHADAEAPAVVDGVARDDDVLDEMVGDYCSDHRR